MSATALRESDRPPFADLVRLYGAVARDVVGRELQLQGLLSVLAAGRNLLLEGPPGTGKSTVLRSVASHAGIPLAVVEGNAEMTPQKMLGYHDPASVLSHGYRDEDFVFGPLPTAMSEGGFLYVEEFNRLPEDTLNTLLTAMSERELHIPRLGVVFARDSFRVIAAMNPFDNVGTARVSVSVYDRLCRMVVGYQSEADELEIVRRRTGIDRPVIAQLAVRITRATRDTPQLRSGASVRGAIDFVLVEASLRRLLEVATLDVEQLITVAELALSSKVVPDESWGRSAEDIVRELTVRLTS
ncbi:MAG TPA: MoxR family ATPase [Jatrophihabitantaceae bacterium]